VSVVVAAALAGGCGSGSGVAGPPPSTGVPVTPTSVTTTPPPPPTTVWRPGATAATSELAAAGFVSAWATGNRVAAAQSASPAAVSALFAAPYPVDHLQFRGCGQVPVTCTYRNTASATGEIYQIVVAQTASGRWFVSSAIVES
jgi:hypothetical protein